MTTRFPVLFQALLGQDLDDFKQQYRSTNIVWRTLRQVFEKELEALRKEREDPNIFQLFSSKSKKDHLDGQIFRIRQLLNLFPVDNGDI